MVRIKPGKETRKRRKKYLKKAKGSYGARSRLYRQARETVEKGLQHAYKGRKLKKRDFRGLWITNISSICKTYGISYSKFIKGLKKANVIIDRKNLSYIAKNDPETFSKLVKIATT